MGIQVKQGMGGSNGGKGRREPTEYLKKVSKKRRRQMSKREAEDHAAKLGLTAVRGIVSGQWYFE